MKTKYQYINFALAEKKPKTSVYACLSNSSGGLLGTVEWYGPWRQYCFFPQALTVFNIGCMDDIKDFIRQLKEERKING